MIVVTRLQGLFIALNGFILSTFSVVLLSFLMNYSLWFVLFIGSLAGSCVDFIWALGMLFQRKVTIQGKQYLVLLKDTMRMYRDIGFQIINNYGQYINMQESISMEKKLTFLHK